MRTRATLAALAAWIMGVPSAAGAAPQAGGPTFADAQTAALYQAAVTARGRLDQALVSYTALVQERMSAALRMPLKDRRLYRSESARRVFWSRDGDVLVQVLGLREQTPLGPSVGKVDLGRFSDNFDPANDQLLFGLVPADDPIYEEDHRDDFWVAHPLDPEFRDVYRYSIGDTLTLSLPDGRRISAVELRVVPAQADVHRITGSLWIEPSSGALVRAAYRLSDTFDALRELPDLAREEKNGDLKHIPGLLKPWTADVRMISVDFARWDGGVWLPRSLHAQGVVRAGILEAPAEMELTYTYESVWTEADLADDGDAAEDADPAGQALASAVSKVGEEGDFRLMGRVSHRGPRDREKRVRFLIPRDVGTLADSPDLPPPIGTDAPGFASEDELRNLFSGLADLPTPPSSTMPRTFRWGLQRPDLVRYNRVEGLSLGARGQVRPDTPFGPLSVTATARLGIADLRPNVRVDLTHESLRRRLTWSAYSELAAVEEGRHLSLGNSLTALLFGRDDGDYYRRAGVQMEWTPPSAERRTFRVRAFGQYEEPADVNTDFTALHPTDSPWAFRPGLVADEGWDLGGAVTVSPWWGSDPRSPQGGFEVELLGAGGDWSYARTSLLGRVALPLPALLRLGLGVGGGTSWGTPPAQRLWTVGGVGSARGYAPRTQVGASFARARAELARQFAFGAVSVFGDGAWAGGRGALRLDDALVSVGVGLSLVDGLIRMDGGWGLRAPRGFRFDLYLDGIL